MVAIAVLAGVYLLSPLDVLPDPIPLLGQIDDLLVLLTAAVQMIRQLRAGSAADRLPLDDALEMDEDSFPPRRGDVR